MDYNFKGRDYKISYPLPESYKFEKSIDNEVNLRWMKDHWHYSIYLSIAYLIVIFTLQRYMKSRPPFDVRRYMAIWNSILAIFSVSLILRQINVMPLALNDIGLKVVVCDATVLQQIPAVTYWRWIYVYSKAIQLADTLFIVLHKGKLRPLHYFHHSATLVLAWYMMANEVSALLIMGYSNAIVHSVMYTYFAFKAMGYKIPRSIAMMITTLQITQMIVGVIVTMYAYWSVRQGKQCDSSQDALQYAFCVYLTYGILFCHLFYISYLKPEISRKKKI